MSLSKLKQIIQNRCFVSSIELPHRRGQECLVITEPQDNSRLRELTIQNVNCDHLCFTFDIGSGDDAQYSPSLNTGTQQGHKLKFNKRCDFIIVKQTDSSEVSVYFGDLKSTRLEKENIFKQLYASKLFFDYVVSILKWEFPNFNMLDNYTPKYVCCHHEDAKQPRRSIRKASQVRNNRQSGDDIQFHPISVNAYAGSIEFDQLCH